MKILLILLLIGTTVFSNSFKEGDLLREFKEIRVMERSSIVQSFTREMRLREGMRKDNEFDGMDKKRAPLKEEYKQGGKGKGRGDTPPPPPQRELDDNRFEKIKDLREKEHSFREEKKPPPFMGNDSDMKGPKR